MTPRFWLRMMDIAKAVRAPHCVYLWLVTRASNATDWGSITPDDGKWP